MFKVIKIKEIQIKILNYCSWTVLLKKAWVFFFNDKSHTVKHPQK